MTEYYFQPAKVQDAAGKTLTIHLTNTGTEDLCFTAAIFGEVAGIP